jgi:hypothetical protein
MTPNRQAVGALAAAATLLVGGAGAALASSGGGDRGPRCDARLAKIAERRGVTVEQLTADVKARLLARLDAAEKAGRISKERATKLRERIESAEPCAGRKHGKHVRARVASVGMLKAAADFLGLDRAQLRAQLPGTSLTALAAKQGKSAGALEAALVAPGKARLAKATANGRLTQAQADRATAKLERLAHRLATKVFPSK